MMTTTWMPYVTQLTFRQGDVRRRFATRDERNHPPATLQRVRCIQLADSRELKIVARLASTLVDSVAFRRFLDTIREASSCEAESS